MDGKYINIVKDMYVCGSEVDFKVGTVGGPLKIF